MADLNRININISKRLRIFNMKALVQTVLKINASLYFLSSRPAGLLIAVALRYRYCSGAAFTVAVAVAPLLLAESSGDSSAATFLAVFLALLATATFKKEN